MSDDGLAPLVEVQAVSRRFTMGSETIWAVRDVSLSVERGEFMALVGRSGSGKTTLLNLIAGLDRPTTGTIRIGGEDITRFSEAKLTQLRRRTIGFVFQSFGLLPLLSAYENVEIALRIAGTGLRERRRRTDELLERVGLSGRAEHRPYELSGGEQQRVAIARALANRPPIILADEPTGELDSSTAVSIFQLLRDLVREENVTIITATHDRTVMELALRIEELHDGRLLQADEQELYRYTTREERSDFAQELPAAVREDVAASTVREPEQRHVVHRRELPPKESPDVERRGPPRQDDEREEAPAQHAPTPDDRSSGPAPAAGAMPDFRPPPGSARPGWAQPGPEQRERDG